MTIPEARSIIVGGGYTVGYEREYVDHDYPGEGATYFIGTVNRDGDPLDGGYYTPLQFRRFAFQVKKGWNPYSPDPRYCPEAFT